MLFDLRLRGVVTSALQGDAVTVQDATRGIFVNMGRPSPLRAGDYCELEGHTVPGEFSPFISASRIERLGPGILPPPAHPSWDQLLNGSLHCQYVELEGVVTSINGVQLDDPAKSLQLLSDMSQANQLTLTVQRGSESQTVNVNLSP